MGLVTRDPATGMRYNPTHWTETGETPNPNGCRWCGHDRRLHCQMWRASARWHKWTEPTNAQRLARMRARHTPTGA
jgi:hypothetical protein